jgi:hypothetical protein
MPPRPTFCGRRFRSRRSLEKAARAAAGRRLDGFRRGVGTGRQELLVGPVVQFRVLFQEQRDQVQFVGLQLETQLQFSRHERRNGLQHFQRQRLVRLQLETQFQFPRQERRDGLQQPRPQQFGGRQSFRGLPKKPLFEFHDLRPKLLVGLRRRQEQRPSASGAFGEKLHIDPGRSGEKPDAGLQRSR